jgi:hypothetical protein
MDSPFLPNPYCQNRMTEKLHRGVRSAKMPKLKKSNHEEKLKNKEDRNYSFRIAECVMWITKTDLNPKSTI